MKLEKNIYKVKSLLCLKVNISTYKPKKVVQCYNCQQSGHKQAGCYYESKSMKCVQAHRTGDCTLTKAPGKATCIICKGEHPSSFKCFPIYLQIGRTNPKSSKEAASVKEKKIRQFW